MANKKTYVLVHGAYQGGWCWKFVAELLRAQGHIVFTPTLTGLGEREHLAALNPDLDMHIADIVQVLTVEELRDVILVGHSLGTAIISGVADCMPEVIRHLVFLDGMILQPGQSVLDGAPERTHEFYRSLKINNGGTGVVPIPPLEFFGMNIPEYIEWLMRRVTPQPVETFFSKMQLNHPLGNGKPITYITCTNPFFKQTEASRAYAKSRTDWQRLEIATGHIAMISAPEQLTQILSGIG
ncbi:MAG TPA: alpha/beta hydrolase [Spongiibacteraceae bacterium]|jgi:pimeloyl-ACP methyl ester carboxylesterase